MELIEKMGRPANDRCTCAEVWGEDPRCILHGVETQWALENTAPEDWQNLASDMMRTIKSLDNKIAALTALMEHAGGDGVTEADKRLFIEIADKQDHDEEIMAGHHFTWEVQQLAHHRATAFAAAKAARDREIVAIMRDIARSFCEEDGYEIAGQLRLRADAIERGEV